MVCCKDLTSLSQIPLKYQTITTKQNLYENKPGVGAVKPMCHML